MSDLKPVAAAYLHDCPYCHSKGFLREKDDRCSLCSGRENGVCIECGEPCPGMICEWCGKDQSLPDAEPIAYSDIEFVKRYGQKSEP